MRALGLDRVKDAPPARRPRGERCALVLETVQPQGKLRPWIEWLRMAVSPDRLAVEGAPQPSRFSQTGGVSTSGGSTGTGATSAAGTPLSTAAGAVSGSDGATGSAAGASASAGSSAASAPTVSSSRAAAGRTASRAATTTGAGF